MKKFIFATIISLIIFTTLSFAMFSQAEEASQDAKSSLEKKIAEYESKLTDLRSQKNTLSSQIQYMDTQIYLTGLKIKESEEKIKETQDEVEKLDKRITGLDTSLDKLSKSMLERIVAGYKNRQLSIVDIMLDGDNASDTVNRLKYYNIVRDANKKVLLQVQEAKLNFEEQKKLREQKIKELDSLAKSLDQHTYDLKAQQISKNNLLQTTQNDEKNYQNLLAQAKAEYTAIQQITAGGGVETEIRKVSKGETIATLISGLSCNSSGTHLHFIVKDGDAVVDPFGKLKQIDNVNDSNGDSFNPIGSWDWPLNPTIYMHQGYGYTWFARTFGWYPSHNGIDITGSSNNVSAVSDGTLYKGSYGGFNGCALSYVKLKHKDSNISTLYLHVYPN